MLPLGLRYAARERLRFAVSAAGVASAVLLTVFLAGVYRGAVRGSMGWLEETDADVWVGRKGSWNLMRCSGLLPASARGEVEAAEGVRAAEPILSGLLPAATRDGRRTLLVLGLDAGATAAVPRGVVEGRPLPGRGEVVIDRAFARRAGVGAGDTLDLAGRPFRVVGVTAGTNLLVTQYAFLQVADLREMLGGGEASTFLLVRTVPGRARDVADRLAASLPGAEAFDRETFLANNRREIDAGFLPVLLAIAALGTGVGVAVVALTTYTVVLEKRADLALLGALGAGEAARARVVIEHALAAGAAGWLLGVAVLAALQQALPFLVPEVEFRLEAGLVAAALGGAVAVALAGALLPARLAARVPPMEVLRR